MTSCSNFHPHLLFIAFSLIFFFAQSKESPNKHPCLSSLHNLNIFVIQDLGNSTEITATEIKDHLSSLDEFLSINTNAKVAVASFSPCDCKDKPNSDRCFDVKSDFTSSSSKYQSAVTAMPFKVTNPDQPSSQFNAMLQAAADSQFHKHDSDNSDVLNVVVVSTATKFSENGKGDTSDSSHCDKKNLVTVKQIRKAFQDSHLKPIILTHASHRRMYDNLLRRLNLGGVVVTYHPSRDDDDDSGSNNKFQEFETSMFHQMEKMCLGVKLEKSVVASSGCKRRECNHRCNHNSSDEEEVVECRQWCREHYPPCSSAVPTIVPCEGDPVPSTDDHDHCCHDDDCCHHHHHDCHDSCYCCNSHKRTIRVKVEV